MNRAGAEGVNRRARAATLAALALLACSLAVVAPSRAEAKAPPEFFGVVPSEAVTPADLDQMAASGVRTLRYMFFWPAIEPSPGSFQWASHDSLVVEAAKRGIRILPMLYGTPGWANFLAGQSGCGPVCAPEADSVRNGFGAFARAVVQRYGPDGDFWTAGSNGFCPVVLCPPQGPPCGCTSPLPFTGYQVWNEQNSEKYYLPTPSPNAYAKLLTTASSAIRSVDPGAEIILGGMWGPPGANEVLQTAQYLKQLYAVPGIANAFDSIAVHPYAPTLDGVKQQMKLIRKTVKQAGDPGVGTWITELGWASGGPTNGLVKSPKAQARLLKKSFRYLIAKRKTWRIHGITWYSWSDVAPQEADCEWCPQSGLRSKSGAEKPAGRAYRRLALGA